MGDFGGVVEVIAFLVYATMNLYHDLVMEQYILNIAILQKDESSLEKDFAYKKSSIPEKDES